jgi:carboxymethylenebutenolidase
MARETIIAFIFSCCSLIRLQGQNNIGPDTVLVQSGKLTLKALLWRPAGAGPFPSIIFCHGSYGSSDTIHDPVQQISLLGPGFAKNGYIFLGLFRRGVGLSQGQGVNSAELMDEASKEKGQEGRNKIQLQQLETDQLQDMISGIRFLQGRRDANADRIAIAGHSFGGSLALLVAEREPRIKAVVIFSGGGYSWDRSPQLRTRLISAVKNITAPVMIIHAQNDYSVNPGYALDSVRDQLKKPHLLKIYPAIGNSQNDGHNLVFLSIETWQADVLKFLHETLQH